MTKSLHAPLSPNEELTLRRVAYGIAGIRDFRRRDLKHLMSLDLIASDGVTVSMTPLGHERFAHLRNPRGEGLPKGDAVITAMAKALGVLH